MFLPCFMHVFVQDLVLPSRSYQDPYGFYPWDPQAENIVSLLLKF